MAAPQKNNVAPAPMQDEEKAEVKQVAKEKNVNDYVDELVQLFHMNFMSKRLTAVEISASVKSILDTVPETMRNDFAHAVRDKLQSLKYYSESIYNETFTQVARHF